MGSDEEDEEAEGVAVEGEGKNEGGKGREGLRRGCLLSLSWMRGSRREGRFSFCFR